MFLFISFAIIVVVGIITDRVLGHQSALEPRALYPDGTTKGKRIFPMLTGLVLIAVAGTMNGMFDIESLLIGGTFEILSICWLTHRFLRFEDRYYGHWSK